MPGMDARPLQRHKLRNLIHTALLLSAMALLLGVLGWLLGGLAGLIWTASLGALALSFSPRLSPAVVLRLYGARPIDPGEAPALYAALAELADRAGLDGVPTLYLLPSRVLNAFTLGDREHGAIALTEAMLRELPGRELLAVLAHELSHVVNNDMRVMGLADLASRITGMLSLTGQMLLLLNLPSLLAGEAMIAMLPLLVLIAAPSVSGLLQLALSRTREYDADLEAAELTGDPEGLAMALLRLEKRQGGWLERLTLPGRGLPEHSLFRTHPPTAERVQRLLALVPGSPRPRIPAEPLVPALLLRMPRRSIPWPFRRL